MTAKLPCPPLIVPAEVAPSPQLIVAEKTPAGSEELGSVNEATVPLIAAGAVPVNELPPKADPYYEAAMRELNTELRHPAR